MSVDRRVAFVCWLLAAAVVGTTAVVSESPGIPVRHDAAAFALLLERLEASTEGDWLVEYEITRRMSDGRSLAGVVTEARHEPYHVLREAEQATIDNGAETVTCLVLEEGLQCLQQEPVEAIPPHEVVRAAVSDAGAYVVTRQRGQRIAGEQTQCFRVFAARGYLAELGAETQYCFARDGVPLFSRTTATTGTDERRARLVLRSPTTDRVEGLLSDLEVIAAEAED
ncbi:MAG: hypothetical protein ACT4OX_08940 [Actinomycetota bacterium]